MNRIVTAFIFFVGTLSLFAQPQIGPENGTLIIVGGGATPSTVYAKMRILMGGPNEHLVVVPTATEPGSIDLNAEKQRWISNGFKNVSVLHTTDTAIANTDSFVAPLKTASAVWFGGGRQWRLVDAYMNTKTLDEFRKVLDRGGVIAGSSAGASIQGSFLARGAVASNVPIISPEPEHRVGFGFLKNSAIDQHIDTRNRWEEMEEIIDSVPGILGIGLSEATAIVVQGDCFEVIGVAQVAITDSTRLNGCLLDTCYEILAEMDTFDLVSRLKGSCNFPTTGIDHHAAQNREIALYPNPAKNSFHIQTDGQGIRSVIIYNRMGIKVFEKKYSGRDFTIELETTHLSSGSYIVQVFTERQHLNSKLIIAH